MTIGIPTFNRASLLSAAIRSALAQTYPNVEVIVSDNASTDGTQAMCQKIANDEPRFHYLRQESNQGASANFRAVLEAAGGQYFMWLGDDDWIEPNYVLACLDVLRSNPSLALAAGSAVYHGTTTHAVQGELFDLVATDPIKRVLKYYRTVTRNGVFYGLAPTAAVRSVPFLGQRLGGDWMHVASLAFRGGVVTTTDTIIHRSSGGVSTARVNLPVHHILMAKEVALDVFRSPTYRQLRAGRRLVLSAQSCYYAGLSSLPGDVLVAVLQTVRAVLPRSMYEFIRRIYRGDRLGVDPTDQRSQINR